MKKIIFAFALALMSTTLLAQRNLELGLRFNPEFTFLLNKNDQDAGGELDYAQHFGYLSFGAGAVYNLNKHIGVGLDILFSREGQAFTGNLGNTIDTNAYSIVVVRQKFLVNEPLTGDYEALSELNFIKLPLMLSLSSDNTRGIFFNFLVGPQINILQGVAQEVDGDDHEYPDTDIEPKDLYKPVTLDGMFAFGAGWNLSANLLLTARLRFDYGFSDVEEKDLMFSYAGSTPVRFYSADRAATHNTTAALMIGVNFKL